jgi:hypothetical protein
MEKYSYFLSFSSVVFLCLCSVYSVSQTKPAKEKVRYDTIIVKHVTTTAKKPSAKPVVKPEVKPEIVIPIPEFINQPCYYDKDGNKLIKLENTTALMVTKKKALGLQGARQFLTMDAPTSKIRFMAKKDIVFIIKTSGDDIDLTSYVKLFMFLPADQKREVTINAKEGVLNDKESGKGKLISISMKMLSKDNYLIQLPEQIEAGEYGFVWLNNMDLKEFNVFGFGIDWKRSDQ